MPTITELDPTWVFSRGAASSDFTLIARGNSFVEESRVQWNGSYRPTSFVSSTELHAVIIGADLVTPGTGGVTVVSP